MLGLVVLLLGEDFFKLVSQLIEHLSVLEELAGLGQD
jgi:hypothetical protein